MLRFSFLECGGRAYTLVVSNSEYIASSHSPASTGNASLPQRILVRGPQDPKGRKKKNLWYMLGNIYHIFLTLEFLRFRARGH